MSAQWLQHHSGHSHQTTGSADPGQHVALTTGQARKLEKKKTIELLLLKKHCKFFCKHTVKVVWSITSAATNRNNQGNQSYSVTMKADSTLTALERGF